MMRTIRIGILVLGAMFVFSGAARSAPIGAVHELAPTELETDIAPPYRTAQISKALTDTIWIADWTFDDGGCNSTGWTKFDNLIQNDGSNYWSVTTQYAGAPGINNKSAKLGIHNLCWPGDGYGNDWDYAIKVKYSAEALKLSFRYLINS